MKVLLLDAGNSCLKWAVLDNQLSRDSTPDHERLTRFGRCRYAGEDLGATLTEHWSDLPGIGRVMLATVAGESFGQEIQGLVQQRWGLSVELLVAPAVGAGIVNAYAEPQRLGVDRWLALVAAQRESAGPVSVVDCGTAVTIDRLDVGGRHQGGLILPGLSMMTQALAAGAARLAADAPRTGSGAGAIGSKGSQTEYSIASLAQDTPSAITGGVLSTLVAAIDRIVSEVDRKSGVSLHMITGGDADLLQPLLSGQWLIRPHLVLEGMALIAEDVT